jgi:hypothetical protein
MVAVGLRLVLIASVLLACISGAVAQQPSAKTEFMKETIKWVDEITRPTGGESFPQFIDIPRIGVFGDWDFYYILSDLRWRSNLGGKTREVVVPKGFVTDLASVPQVFWSILPKTGRYAYAAIVHDYLYWTQNVSRDEADSILEIAMKDSRVDMSTLKTITTAVTIFGQSAWDANKKLKAAGEKRVLKIFPNDALTSWGAWRKTPGVFAD